jgi:4-amino-4-deoxy-L-arabinose transferase-like glycosyltransferase
MRSVLARLRLWITGHPLAAVLLMALLLRLINLDGRSLAYDDVFSIFLARRPLPEIVAGTAADTMPPLFYFLLHFWLLLGSSVWWIRLLSVLIGLSALALFFLTVQAWLGRPTAAWAALLFAISPLQIYHAQDVRMYALMLLGQVGYAFFFTRLWFASQAGDSAVRPTRWWDWAGLVLFGVIAMYSHNLAVFPLLAADLFLLLRRQLRLLARLVLAQLLIALAFLPWLLLLPGQLEKINRAFWTPRPGLLEVVQAVLLWHAALPLPMLLMALAVLLSFWVLALTVLEVAKGGPGAPGVAFFACLALLPPVLLFAISYVMRPVFVTRGFLAASLGYYALVAFAISRAWQRGGGKLIAGAFLLAALISLPGQWFFSAFPRSPYRQAVADLQHTAAPTAVVIHDTKLSYFPAAFYAPGLPQVFLADAPGTFNDTFAPASQQAMQVFPQPDLASAVGDSRDVYFITFSQVYDEYSLQGIQPPPNVQWLMDHFILAGKARYNDLIVDHYVR